SDGEWAYPSNLATVGRFFGVWGDESAVWFVGEGGMTARVTRAEMSSKTLEWVESPVRTPLRSVFGFGSDDVWAVGDESTVLHWDGTTWSKLSTPFDDAAEKPRLHAVWGSSPQDVWIVGENTLLHFQESQP